MQYDIIVTSSKPKLQQYQNASEPGFPFYLDFQLPGKRQIFKKFPGNPGIPKFLKIREIPGKFFREFFSILISSPFFLIFGSKF